MATDPSLAIQGALIAAIKAIPTAAGSNVYDTVPPSNPFPRVTVGLGQSIPDMADCRDGTESIVQIDVWSRGVGYPEAKGIGDLIRGRLNDGDLTVAGHALELMLVELLDYSRDPDGHTSRGRMSLRILTSPLT